MSTTKVGSVSSGKHIWCIFWENGLGMFQVNINTSYLKRISPVSPKNPGCKNHIRLGGD